MLALYHNDVSVCAQKVRMCLAEKNLNWEDRHHRLRDGAHLTHEYLKLNPNGVVPTLVHDERVIIESTVINEYLDTAFADPPLRPADAYDRAHMRIWTKQVDDSLHGAVGTLSFCIAFRWSYLERSAEENEIHIQKIPSRARRERRRRTVELGVEAPDFEDALLRYDKLLTDMEAALADRQWLLGDAFSLADVSLIPYITRLEALALDRMFEGRPRFSGWFERVKSRASYDQAFTQWLNPYYQKMMREKGLEAWPAAADIIAAS